jgi:hypothetical protein
MKTVVVLSVDWEPDHGKWQMGHGKISYDGIREGTIQLERILDGSDIPCTWFVETSRENERDISGLFPDIIKRISARGGDEIGLHIHWRRTIGSDRIIYETEDQNWIAAQIDHGIERLSRMGIRPKCFRSGALLRVRMLPKMLLEKGMQVDSSTLWGICNRLNEERSGVRRAGSLRRTSNLLNRTFKSYPDPYGTSPEDVEVEGECQVLEFPIFSNIIDLTEPVNGLPKRLILKKTVKSVGLKFLTLFFHIDELLRERSRSGDRAECDPCVFERVGKYIDRLKNDLGVRFATLSEARDIYLRSCATD